MTETITSPRPIELRPASTTAKPTQTSQALQRIRDDILNGLIAPGERLIVANLVDNLATSQTPIREALMRLVSEGLVLLEDQRGFSVAPVSRDELVQLTEARAEIEALVLGASIARGDDQWEGQVVADLHRLQKATQIVIENEAISPEWEARHEQFHRTLVSACGNQILLEIRDSLFRRATRYRRLSVRYMAKVKENFAFHQEIADAALRRDVSGAEQAIKEHIRSAARSLLDEQG